MSEYPLNVKGTITACYSKEISKVQKISSLILVEHCPGSFY
jgi:hypothetical protein